MGNKAINAMLAKQAITEVLYSYCRGLDRMDKAMAYAVFHEDCKAVYHDDIYEGTGHGFVDWVWTSHEAMSHHSHQMTNILIQLEDVDDPLAASSETYVTVRLLTLPDEDGKQHMLSACSRYLDRWEKRNGRWAISEREHILDFQAADGMPVAGGVHSHRSEEDASFQLIKSGGWGG